MALGTGKGWRVLAGEADRYLFRGQTECVETISEIVPFALGQYSD